MNERRSAAAGDQNSRAANHIARLINAVDATNAARPDPRAAILAAVISLSSRA